MKCECKSVDEFDDNKKRECYVNSPKHFNCWFVWEHFWNGEPLTLEEVGDLLGVSYERIRQNEITALAKFKKGMEDELRKERINDEH